MCRFFQLVPFLIGVLVACVGALLYEQYESRPRFVVEQPDREFINLKVGEVHRFTYRIQNLTNKPIRVVGAEFT